MNGPNFWGFIPKAIPIVGIDIGLKGALAYVWANQEREIVSAKVFDLPHKTLFERKVLDIKRLMELIEDHCFMQPACVAIEEPVLSYNAGAIRSSGKSLVTSLTNYGRLSYVLETCFDADRCFSVAATTWKRHLGVGKDKHESVRIACENFPDVEEYLVRKSARGRDIIEDGRAEALLIAWYAMKNLWLPDRSEQPGSRV